MVNLCLLFRLQGVTVNALHAAELRPVFEQLRLQLVQMALVGQTLLLRCVQREGIREYSQEKRDRRQYVLQ